MRPMHHVAGWVCVCILTATLTAGEVRPANGEWPTWRGPNRNGISTETGLLKNWPKEGPPLLWQVDGLGSGYSSVAISGGKIFSLGGSGDGTQLIALDLNDGTRLWSTHVGEASSPNCTPTVDGSLVFGLDVAGELLCSDVSDGHAVWRKSFRDDFGGRMMSGWGFSESPLVDGDRLICTPGSSEAMIVALDKRTGQTIWKAEQPENAGGKGADGAAYSSVVVSEACGIRQYVQLTGRGLISVDAATGRVLWTYNRIANGTANIPTPLISGNHVFCSTGYGTGAALVEVVRNGAELEAREVYFLEGSVAQNHHGGMVLVDGHVYFGHGNNQGFPLCLELESGKVAWNGGRGAGRGSAAVLFADGHLYFRYDDGMMALIEGTPESYVLKSKFRIASNNGKSWPHPVIANRRLYLRDQQTLLCYDVAEK